MEPEKVIFRYEWNPETRRGTCLACFPDDPANPGRIACLPMDFNGDSAVFEPFCEVSLDYYYKRTRILHKGSSAAIKCKEAIEKYYGHSFRVVEKIMHDRLSGLSF